MTEQTNPPEGAGPDESFEWTGADTADAGAAAADEAKADDSTTSARAKEWVGQLQAMIDDIATQASPTIRQVGVKAAELAAIAGDKAGPIAQKAAAMTESAGTKLAERSRAWADEIRGDANGHDASDAAADAVESAGGAVDTAVAEAEDKPQT